ncbi:MAG: hypothetical protein IOD12_02895 [Silvanigrellales bacterium]|nr:hypothetical protein [Silvanigrellales bacterium]
MPKKIFKNTIVSLRLRPTALFSFVASLAAAVAPTKAAGVESRSPASLNATDSTKDSFRLTFALGSPRRFATRFNKETRTLELRVSPAKADEFKSSAYFDTRYVRRVVVQEKGGDVILSLQLKNAPVGWVVATKDSPWRIVLDIWRVGPSRPESLEEAWDWQEDAYSSLESSHPATPHHTQGAVAPQPDSPVDVPSLEGSNANTSQTAASGAPSEKANSSDTAQPSDQRSAQGRKTPNDALFPKNFGALERKLGPSPEKLSTLQRLAGASLGRDDEFEKLQTLARELHVTGDDAGSLATYRKLAVLSERRFLEQDSNLWSAGESAYLVRNFDAAEDYFRALALRHPSSALTSQAKLRLLDMELLTDENEIDKGRPSKRYADEYARIAASEASTSSAKIAASLRLLAKKIESAQDNADDETIATANLYSRTFDTCVTSDRVTFEMQNSCAYILTRTAISKSDVLSADGALLKFKNAWPKDARAAELEKKVQLMVQSFLEESLRTRTWDAWVSFERKARPALFEFTLKNPELTFARADAFDTVGDSARSLQLYEVFWQTSAASPRRDEAAARGALLAAKLREGRRVETNLRRLQESATRRATGLNDKSVAALRELTMPPNGNARALSLLLDEMRYGRYVERELAALLRFASMLRRSPSVDAVFEKILQAPLKGAEETAQVEAAIMGYANDLRDSGRLQKSAEMFMAVAGLAQGGKRAEAAYKAGIVFARSGQIEKAKASWQAAASDLSDKRYSNLAAERLERLR